MLKRYIPVTSDQQLESCMQNGIAVDVWIQGDLEASMHIISFDELSIEVVGGRYLRVCVELRVKESFLRIV
ncbi:hypothetical protein ACFSR7_34490 [Cohnella sp. GCM10020058]|uniref:hypothetical protein n=1 Tax=Cohnella sp. GCM10020058 TaxID=3317330 RepID=UPI00362AE4C0